MAEEISKLLDLFRTYKSDRDLAYRFRSDSVRPGLELFLASLENYESFEIDTVVSVAKLLVSACVSSSVERGDAVGLVVMKKILAFCLGLLEKLEYNSYDFNLQNSLVQLLEVAFSDGSLKEYDSVNHDCINTYVEQLAAIPVKPISFNMQEESTSYLQGTVLKDGDSVDEILKTLLPEASQPDIFSTQFYEPHSSNRLMNQTQLLAATHVKCIPRLLILCRNLLAVPDSSEENAKFSLRLEFVQRILKIVVNIAKELVHDASDGGLLQAVCSCAVSFPPLFRLKVDYVNRDSSDNIASPILQLLEDFLLLVKVSFHDGCVFYNIRTYLLSSILDVLAPEEWKYNASDSSPRPPLVYCPQVVLYILKLLKDSKNSTCDLKDPNDADIGDLFLQIRAEKILLLKRYGSDDCLRMIFPPSKQWLGNLLQLAFFLHNEALKLRQRMNKAGQVSVKAAILVSESDNTTVHDEEAIFGNLFSEANRSVALSDDQQTTSHPFVPNAPSMMIEAATELMLILKDNIFSSEWNSMIYDGACKKLNGNHISLLLSMLNSLDSLHKEKNIERVCFELLRKLITSQVLSTTLKVHLADQVLKVENGAYIYNNHTLTLLSHALISRTGSDDNNLSMKIFKAYGDFILDKTKDTVNNNAESDNFFAALPCAFYLDILLMAYHLSDEDDKATLANYILSSIKTVDAPKAEFSGKQLVHWAFAVSRLLLVIRHVVAYPSVCPSWLLMRFKSRLRDTPSNTYSSQSAKDNIPSWISIAVENILGDSTRETRDIGMLIPQLIDSIPHPVVACRDGGAFRALGLNLDMLISTFSSILSFWRGKKAETVDQLILERYIFLLCWGTISSVSSVTTNVSACKFVNIDLLTCESFFYFGVTSLHNNSVMKVHKMSEVIINLLRQLHMEHVRSDNGVESWDFLRRSAWLSLVLSMLYAGVWKYSMEKEIIGIEQSWIYSFKSIEFTNIVDTLYSDILDDDKIGFLFNVLSSFLRMYVQVLQESFLSLVDKNRVHGYGVSPLSLLKLAGFDNSKREFLLQKCGFSASSLDSLHEILVKLDEIIAKEDTGDASGVFLECLFHGIPSHYELSGGILLSCMLSIRELVCILDGCLKVNRGLQIETDVLNQLLDSLRTIRSDKLFQCIHTKCDDIYDSLIPQQKLLPGTSELYALMHIESLLTDINSRETIDHETHEMLIASFVDIVLNLKKDNSKESLKYYLCADAFLAEETNKLFIRSGDILILIDALGNCYSESVNLRALNLFTELLAGGCFPGLKEKLQMKFLKMDLFCLSHWLEVRLLGCATSSLVGAITAKGSSTALRESTIEFITHLISQPQEKPSLELQGRLIEAMLFSLDSAFTLFDINSAKSFFSFVVKLLDGESSVKLLMEKTITLMGNLVGNDALLPGLKYLFGFMGSLLGECDTNKNASDRLPSKLSSSTSFGSGSLISKPVDSRKNPENLIPPVADNSLMDCDAMSADEDEDDGTSDGELGSIDKDDEDDSNSERTFASKVCTFTSSGSNFMEQHWYFCYTCDLTVSKGCCSVCAKVCHRGHRVVYSRSSRFFCDCGAGGVRGSSCQCLKPRKLVGSNNPSSPNTSNLQPLLPFPEDGDLGADSDSDLDNDLCSVDFENFLKVSIPKEVKDNLPVILQNLNLEDQVIKLCKTLLPMVISRREANLSKDKNVILGNDKILSYSLDLFQLKKAFKSGSFDLKIKADYPNSRELKARLSSGSLTKSLLSISIRGKLAVGEGDKVSIFDVGQLIGQPTVAPVTADKTNTKPLSKNIVRYEIVSLLFNPMTENYLAVAGYEECQVLTVNPRGDVTDRLAIELALQGAYICKVEWVPGSQVQLMVVTNMFVKIYDLSQDNISPIHYFTLSDSLIVDATLVPASLGKVYLLVLSESGCVYRLQISIDGDIGAKVLTEEIQVHNNNVMQKGLSLYFSSTYRLLFLTYQDGSTIMGRLDANASSLSETSYVFEDDQDNKIKPAGLHHFRELLPSSGLFTCFSSTKSNSISAVCLGPCDISIQNMRYGAGSPLPLVGIAAYKPLSKDKSHCLVLHDDGSLQIYSFTQMGSEGASNASSDRVKKIGPSILHNRAYSSSNPEFPLDFFEKTTCITSDVRMSSDDLKHYDSESIKQRLTSDDGFLESPTAAGFKITISNPNPDMVMVGIRVHVGNSSASHIPSEIIINQRVVRLDEGMRSWYDIPFTTAESLVADEEFSVNVGRTFNGSTMPRIDCLEVYGRAKDEFGWKEKMDAVLDMEAHELGADSSSGANRKYIAMQTAPIYEQVMTYALKLLSRIYSLCRMHVSVELEDANLVLNNLKCKNLLESIFQSDREPLLHSAACLVLQSVFPRKEIYYHVKDTMRLLGVMNSIPTILSRIGIGGAPAGWVIKEFTAQMNAVSKISVHRRSNMVAFLGAHGSGVVDGLMQVLWGILDVERPETQTVNNIVIPAVELIYSYAECLALHGTDASGRSVAPAVSLLKKLLFAPYEAVQTSSSLAISSRLLQVPFPKQTMLTSDDAPDHTSVSHNPSNLVSATGNAQAMIEEDPATSSVQYCCDGCSTVPILRRRWHCNICPDFDLCEACYEILDPDRLPPPHSRDHAMTAIPIEIDILGGDSNAFHLPVEDENDANLMPVAASDISVQNSPAIQVSETIESGDFPSSGMDQRIVSISASKRAVNSLLICQLIDGLNGWMKTTSGVRAIPVMQLFYRLSSAVGGPFMDSSKPENLDLEKFVRWFIDEININKPFPAETRSFFGEVAILVFMFFTLMLRNWQQPGSDSSQSKSVLESQESPSVVQGSSSSLTISSSSDSHEKNEFASQLVRACSSIRQQAFLTYLMDILQQLVHIFESSSASVDSSLSGGSGCGSLLIVRRDLPAGNFSPFFSDSYAKAHRSDLFKDYHKLLLENTFRLVYSLVRPEKQDKSAEKDKQYKASAGKELKLDGYQDVLCSYISNPSASFVRRYARRLFLHLCGSKTQYYSVRDSWQFSNELKKLYKLVNKSGGFQNAVPYERAVKLVKCLSSISEAAVARPRNWQKYCSKHNDILPFLINGIFYFSEESVIQTLKLLSLAFYTGKDSSHSVQKLETGDGRTTSSKGGSQPSDFKKKRKSEDGAENSSERLCVDMEQATEIFSDQDCRVLRKFIDSFLLEWYSASVRGEAKCVLYGIWYHGKQLFKETMLAVLLQKVNVLPMYGQNIMEYIDLMTGLLGKVTSDVITKQSETELVGRCLTSDVVNCIFETLHAQNELIANHPNSRIYNTLSSLVEFEGYYLESDPCVACSCPETPYSRLKLESLKAETKFTDNRIIVKCTGSYTIQAVTMNVHDARKSKSVKVLNLYYNNRPVVDLSELKNNWSLWKRAKSCHLSLNQTELKVDFSIPITACNFMIELDSFYENLQASSLESLQCPRCSRPVTDKHGICSNCHENAYQCRQCRNINYENLDSFLCNECGYSKYGRFEFNFMAKPSFSFDIMENDEDMKKGLAAIEAESENAHRRYQQLLGLKKPLLKLVSSIGESEIDSHQKDAVQQMMVSLPGPSGKINRKIALLGVVYGDKCKAAFDSVSKSVQTLQGLRRVLMTYLHQKNSENTLFSSRFVVSRSPSSCYGCATTFVTQCMELLQVLSKYTNCKKQLVDSGILKELFENNIHQGPKTACVQARAVLCAFSVGDAKSVAELNTLIQKKVMYCLEHHRSMDVALATREELLLLSETCSLADEFWESRLRVAFQLLFTSIKLGAKHPAISEHIILPCLRIISHACTPPKTDTVAKDQATQTVSVSQLKSGNNTNPYVNPASTKSSSGNIEKQWDGRRKGQDITLLTYSEWEKGASYLDFVRRQYKVSQVTKNSPQRSRQDTHKVDYLVLKYGLKWKRRSCQRTAKNDFTKFALGSWVSELILSACSQSIRSEVCNLISLLCSQNTSRRFQLLNLLLSLLPATLPVGESAAEYFELLFKMIDSESTCLFLTVRGCLTTICKLITQEVSNIEAQERSLNIDISQGFILHKLIELLSKFLEVPNIRARFMRDDLLSQVLEALLIIRGLIVQKTKLISDCNRLLKDLLDSLLMESDGNKRQFIRACISGLQNHQEKKGRTSLFILEQLCNIICPSKAEPVYHLILNKSHTQEEFIRGSMTKNPYSSTEIGPLMRDVKNKICHQLDLMGLVEDDFGMELLVAGNIVSLDLSISQVYEQVWKKHHSQSQSNFPVPGAPTSGGVVTSARECPPMTVTYRLQGLDGEATEPMIKELDKESEETQDPEVEFAIAGAVREFGGLEIILNMIQPLTDDELKSNQEELSLVLNLLMYCCKIQENRRALLKLGALGLLLETARRAFSVDAMEPAEGILLIVESLTLEANESDIGITVGSLTITSEESGAGKQAKKIVLMFLERLCHPLGSNKSNKQQRNNEMVARILPYLTYGEPAAMEALIDHFDPYLRDWSEFDRIQKLHEENPKDESLTVQAAKQRSTVENFVRVSGSLSSSCGERLKDIILEKGITGVAVRHLKVCFAVSGQEGFKTTAEWAAGLKLPSIPLILSMLRGLSKGHLATQKCIEEEGILYLLHSLEGVSGENDIGARAENLLDTLADSNGDGFLGEQIHKLRDATKDEMRRRALKKRQQLLQGLGMRQELASDGGERIVVAQLIIEGLEDVKDEEDGLACMVCREGYSLRPNDILGVYCYSKRVNLGSSSSVNSRGDWVYTTVSHFNIIHFQCHQEARRADAALKNPKKEWDGATLRNNETLCNCIFPLRGPAVPLAQYVRCVDQYWDNLNALGRADGSRLRLLTYDIALMLARFATRASFSTDCKGGGRESNSRLLPFMIQMASYLLEQGSSNTRILSPARSSSSSGTTEESVQFMMVNSLLSDSYFDWSQHRPSFLKSGIHHAYMQNKHGQSTSADPKDSAQIFTIIQPMLVYIGLVEQLQRFFKLGGAGKKDVPWDVVMKEKLVDMKEMVGFSKEMLSWLDDMGSASDLQEVFDIMGVLGDVLGNGVSCCDEFVQAAIAAGPNV